MKRFALILVLASVAAAQSAGEESLRREGFEALAVGNEWRGRRRLKDFLEKHPESKHAPQVTLALALSYKEDAEEVGYRIELLERILREHPNTNEAAEARGALRSAMDYATAKAHRRTEFPAYTKPGSFITVQRDGGGGSAYRIHMIPAKPLLKALLVRSFEDLERRELAADELRDHWQLIDTGEVEFDSKERQFEADLTRPGNYVIEEETLGLKTLHWVRVQATAVFAKCVGEQALVYTGDPLLGAPRAGVKIRVVADGNIREFRTGDDGLCRFPLEEPSVLIATTGEELDYLLLRPEPSPDRALVHIATDRPIYRPGQTVHFKAIHRELARRQLRFPAQREVKVEVHDPEGRTLQSETKQWSDLGTLTGNFEIGGDEPPIGPYTVLVHVPRREEDDFWLWWDEEEVPVVWFKVFQVAAYRKPDLKVTVKLPDVPVEGGKRRARIEAEYFFGGPVPDAAVEWSVWRRDWRTYDPIEWLVPRAPMDDPLEWFPRLYDEHLDWLDEDYGDMIAEGKGITGSDGVFEFDFEADPGESWEPGFMVRAEVRDKSNRTAEGEAEMGMPRSALELRVGTDRMFYEPGEKARVIVRLTDGTRQALRDREVELTAFLQTWEEGWDWSEYESFFQTRVRTDLSGRATCEIPLKEGGPLRLRARARDRAGRRAQDRADLFVFHKRGPPRDEDFDLISDRLVYTPGETMRFLARTQKAPLTCLLTV
ncbi:MAG: MG2 domain-containing protein, partial [Planctomycetota bacterium]